RSMILGPEPPIFWIGFLVLIVILLALDLGVFHRKAHVVSARESLLWTIFWIALALIFDGFVFLTLGTEKGIDFFTGYLIEKSLSVDNLFVIALVFQTFAVPRLYQHRVLFWGILGAIVMRGVMILVGVQLIERFHWVIYVFGGFLLFSGGRMLLGRGKEPHPEHSYVFRIFRQVVPMTERYDGQHFFTLVNGKRMATPLLAALVSVEAMDVVFALDSIPAIFAVTTDPFIVFTSNIFAILGLRSLFFLLANALDRFTYLDVGLAVILIYVGLKMLASDVFPIPSLISLGVVVIILGVTIAVSLLLTREEERPRQEDGVGP